MRCRHGHVATGWIWLAALGLLGACGGGDDGRPSADPSASAPVTSTDAAPSHTVVSMKAAADQYMTMVAAPNCAIDELNAAIHDVATTPSGAVSEDAWPAVQATVVPALVKVEESGRAWATKLLKAEWPPQVSADVQKLALAVTETSDRYGEIARTEDYDAFFELYNSADTTAVFKAGTAAAETVREDLALASVTTNPPDWCALATSG